MSKCYGQVCGKTYPCDQKEYVKPCLEERRFTRIASTAENYEAIKASGSNGSVPIYCADTGKSYQSVAAAAEDMHINPTTLRRALKESHGFCIGYQFDLIRYE